jgi:hypothetical protein
MQGDALMSFLIRTVVALAILVPYCLARQPHEPTELFVISLIAFGGGRLVAALACSPGRAGGPDKG